MDGLSIAASILAVIQVADRVISLCKFYLALSRDAPSDIRIIWIETSSLRTILDNIQFLTANGHGLSLNTLVGSDGPIEGCRKALGELSGLFPSDNLNASACDGGSGDRSQPKRRKLKDVWATLAWPFKEGTARKLLVEIAHHKTTLNLALTADISHDIKHIKEKANEIHETLTESQRHEVYKCLDDIDPSDIHHRSCRHYEPGTGNWMLRSEDWKAWISGKKRALWIHGIPGAGKTVLASHLIEAVKTQCDNFELEHTERKAAHVYYYCYFGHDTDEASPFLKWTIRQLCRRMDLLPAELYKLYKNGERPTLADLLNLLEIVAKPFEYVYIMLDAIDESMPRSDLLKVLRDIITDPRFGKIRVLATSREYIDIEEAMKEIAAPISMRNPLLDEDIRLFVRAQLRTHQKLRLWSPSVQDEALEALSAGAKGMFRWVVCQIDILQRLKGNRDAIRKALQNLPRGLDETYERIFDQIPDDARPFVHHTLKWIYSHNALHQNSITLPILIQATQRSTDGLDPSGYDYDFNEDLLREFCGCLILVTPEERRYEPSTPISSVSFAHYTVLEFLNSSRVHTGLASYFAINNEIVKLEYANVVMQETLNTKTHELCSIECWDDEEIEKRLSNAVGEDLGLYSILSATVATAKWGSALSTNPALCKLAFAMFDASKQHFVSFREAVASIDMATEFQILSDTVLGCHRFWFVDWKDTENDDIRTLVNLLLTDRSAELGQKYIASTHAENWLKSSFELELDMFRLSSDDDTERCVIKGGVVDFFAVIADAGSKDLRLLLDLAVGYFDPTKILMSSIGWHDHIGDPDCRDNCYLTRLFQLGADPDGHGYRICPMQIAVGVWDLDGVRSLLEVGADPNRTGDRGGEAWDEGTALAVFNKVVDRSPLNILEHMNCVFKGQRCDQRKESRPMIRKLLHQYGAKNFRA